MQNFWILHACVLWTLGAVVRSILVPVEMVPRHHMSIRTLHKPFSLESPFIVPYNSM